MDNIERAEAENKVHRQAWEKNRRRFFEGESMIRCNDCGRPIPAARRAALATDGLPCERCIACQEQMERGAHD